jgi:DNA-directed RNA polymerase subunit beta
MGEAGFLTEGTEADEELGLVGGEDEFSFDDDDDIDFNEEDDGDDLFDSFDLDGDSSDEL